MSEPQLDRPRGWKHRRIGFYLAWGFLAAILIRMMVGPELPEGNREPLITAVWGLCGVIIAFYGGDAWEKVTKARR